MREHILGECEPRYPQWEHCEALSVTGVGSTALTAVVGAETVCCMTSEVVGSVVGNAETRFQSLIRMQSQGSRTLRGTRSKTLDIIHPVRDMIYAGTL